MPLDPLHAEILRAVASLPGKRQIALAGGGAMIAHGLVDRVTTDVDLFTPVSQEVGDLAIELAALLRAHGHEVVEVRHESTFVRLNVVTSRGRQTAVEIAVDARLRPLVQLEVGPVLDQDELAADKILALFGRADARPRPG